MLLGSYLVGSGVTNAGENILFPREIPLARRRRYYTSEMFYGGEIYEENVRS